MDVKRILEILDNLEYGGYEKFMNYRTVKKIITQPDSAFVQLYKRVIAVRYDIDLVNLVCTINGAVCIVAEELHGILEALRLFSDADSFDEFIAENQDQILQISLSKNNNPTIPQRAIPIAVHLPDLGSEIGLLELGCSRGDIGLVLMNLDQFLESRTKYWNYPDKIECMGISEYN